MARPFVELYINDKKVYFKEPPEIFVTYAHTDLHNPTVVKNSYTKTITVEGTPENNRIFNDFYDMRRINGDDLFNPSRKESFTLYRNGEPMESGYVKLDKVNRKGNRVTYDITLYGGLGQFLYNLQYKEDGEPMKLSDLEYDFDMDLEINKTNVLYAWNRINNYKPYSSTPAWLTDSYKIFDKINFAPCYNGIPDNFSADKVAIDVQSFIDADDEDLSKQFITESDGYKTIDGWVLGELKKEYDENQMLDYRSYLQRPVIKFKEIIKACCDPNNNGGYTVNLDSDFFNSDNPYYEDAWMTLPLLNELSIENTEVKDASISVSNNKITVNGCKGGTTYNLSIPMTLNIVTDDSSSDVLSSYVYIHCSGKYDTGNSKGTASAAITDYGGVYYAQLVAYNSSDKAIAGSNILVFGGTGFNQDSYLKGVYKFEPVFETSYVNNFAQWYRQSNGTYNFGSGADYLLTISNLEYESGMYFKVILKEAENIYAEGTQNFTDLISSFYPQTQYVWTESGNVDVSDCQTLVQQKQKEVEINGKASPVIINDIFLEETYDVTERRINKKILLNSKNAPCDYFLSYIKMFNLHIWKDMYEKIIYVKLRKNFFTDEIKDIDEFVDRGDTITIKPLTFENKWLNFKSEYETDEKLHKDYLNEYGLDYGIQKVDTNYSFDSSSKDVLDKNILKGCITTRQKSKYFVDLHISETEDIQYPPFMLDGCQTFLFKDGDTVEGSYITPKTTAVAKKWWDKQYYDLIPKPNFTDKDNNTVDGANVLLFYNGKQEVVNKEGDWIFLNISDDIPQFEQLNEGEPCWIWTYDSSVVSRPPYLPIFGRYITNENSWVTHSWDFGTPKALYVPDYSIDQSSCIYTQYWQPYIRDQYDANTRVVECKVLLRERVVGDWLQNFYYWDGRYWVLNKIVDYNPVSNGTTKCEFISVNDTNNYKS